MVGINLIMTCVLDFLISGNLLEVEYNTSSTYGSFLKNYSILWKIGFGFLSLIAFVIVIWSVVHHGNQKSK